MKQSARWLLYLIPILLGCVLAVGYLFSIKRTRLPFAMPTLTDSMATQGKIWQRTECKMYIHEPLYIGPWQQHISLRHPTDWESFPPDAQINEEENDPCRAPDSITLQLLVDTGQRIAHYVQDPSPQGSIISHITLSYPVMLANLSSQNLCIGGGSDLSIIQEALDSMGRWRPIEKPFVYNCIPGMSGRRLLPGHIAIAAAPIYEGSYHTRMRVRYGAVVSNEFMGSINPSQFN